MPALHSTCILGRVKALCVMEVEMSSNIFLTVREAADITKVTAWTVRRWLRSGELKGYKIGGRRLIRKAELLRLIVNDAPKVAEQAR